MDIREMFDLLESGAEGASSEKIKEMTMKKIKEEKEGKIMKIKSIRKIIAISAAAAVFISATAFAAYKLLTPSEIASHAGYEKLAQAIEDEGTMFDTLPQQSGDYTISLLGIVSGKGLSYFESDIGVHEDRSYIIGAIERTDGKPLFDYPGLMLTPLISGHKPWEVNIFTLGGGKSEFIYEDQVDYFVYECDDLAAFKDNTVYIAVYEGIAPDNATFEMKDDGSISFKEDYEGVQALFEIPFN